MGGYIYRDTDNQAGSRMQAFGGAFNDPDQSSSVVIYFRTRSYTGLKRIKMPPDTTQNATGRVERGTQTLRI